MKIKTLIVEDEQDNVDVLNHFLKSYCKQIEVVDSASSVKEAKAIIIQETIDLILLDIMLEDGTGFDLLELIKNEGIPVIFITAYNDFAIKAFKYSAVDYLLKPIQIEELVAAITKVEKQLGADNVKNQMQILMNHLAPDSQEKDDDFIAIPMVEKIEFIKIDTISHLQADGKYSTFVLESGKSVVSSKNIGEYEKLLENNNSFIRVHNTFIVNLNFVSSISKVDGLFCVMKNKTNIPISRRKKEDLFVRLKIKNN